MGGHSQSFSVLAIIAFSSGRIPLSIHGRRFFVLKVRCRRTRESDCGMSWPFELRQDHGLDDTTIARGRSYGALSGHALRGVIVPGAMPRAEERKPVGLRLRIGNAPRAPLVASKLP